MPRITLIFAAVLIVLGIVGYVGTPVPASDATDATVSSAESETEKPKRSVTALIPAFTGGLLAVFGVVALKESLLKHAMHGAVLVGLLGCLAASGRAIPGLVKMMSGDSEVNSRSLFFVTCMAIICGVYVALCVRSFIEARRRRTSENVAPS